jgi:beta-phosphoglucomutase-like phosphatase (HAD superfamily)
VTGLAIRAVLWDIDGTLLDSEPWHFAAVAGVCAATGHPLPKDLYDGLLGRSMLEVYALVTALAPLPLSFDAFVTACNDGFIAEIHRVPARPGSLERVEANGDLGLIQACVSNSGRRVVEANMARIALPDRLAFAISRDDVTCGKPDPEPYLQAARRLGLPPESCAVVEDSPIGARAALAAGMLTIAWPQHPGLAFDPVHRVVDDLGEIDWPALAGRAG